MIDSWWPTMFAANDWPPALTDDQMPARLLALLQTKRGRQSLSKPQIKNTRPLFLPPIACSLQKLVKITDQFLEFRERLVVTGQAAAFIIALE